MSCVKNILAATFIGLMAVGSQAFAQEPGLGDKPAAEKSAKEKSAADKRADRFIVPDGTPKELAQYIKELVTVHPANAEERDKMRASILKAAEKILAGKPNAEEMEFGVQAKMNMLADEKQLVAFAEELQKGGHAALAREVRGFILQVEISKAAQAAMQGGSPDQLKAAITKAVKYFEASPPEKADRMLAILFMRSVPEMTGDNQFAVDTYKSLAKAFAASKDEKLAEVAGTFEAVARRLDLVGHEMKIEGTLFGGGAFDWAKYAGKVVLIDFWATWCGPCVQEIPNVKKCYELYHDKGFEVIGLSLDKKADDLKRFLAEKKIPWPIIYAEGKESPTIKYYGITGIPCMILIGKDGKVVSIGARGDQLRAELTKLLGPVEEKKEKKEGDKAGK